MNKVKFGILREGKVPPDKRVPFTPEQCAHIMRTFKEVEIVVQPSKIRAFADHLYEEAGIVIQEDLSDCDILLGVKEVNVNDLIPNKKFLFFSHTIKKQEHNRGLLSAILDKKIQLIDYELLKNTERKRVTGFGRFAGIVGCYNGFMAYGMKTGKFSLKRVRDCHDRKEMEDQLKLVQLEKNTKIVVTGFGKVGYGAREILDLMPILEVSPEEFLTQTFDQPVYTHLETEDYYRKKADHSFSKSDFYENPGDYEAILNQYVREADLYFACHFWGNQSPKLLTPIDFQEAKQLKVVADISCDVADPIACTLRASTIDEPVYGYNPGTNMEDDWSKPENIIVMAVDNLPCELPKEASEDFGVQLINNVLPHLLNGDPEGRIFKASESNLDGKLNEQFGYLQNYVDGVKEN